MGWSIEDSRFAVGGRRSAVGAGWFSDAHEEKDVWGEVLVLGRLEERALRCLSL